MTSRFVGTCNKKFKTSLRKTPEEKGEHITTLLWGDLVHELETQGDFTKITARERTGWVPTNALSDTSLLEIYVTDCGQGDAILVKTPNGKWHLLDGGTMLGKQMTKTGAPNFVRWKFIKDLMEPKVSLENVFLTHADLDHFGGLIDLFSGHLYDDDRGARPFEIDVQNFYHNGMARFKDAPPLGAGQSGRVTAFPRGDHGINPKGKFIAELLDNSATFLPARPFDDDFGGLAALASLIPHNVRRLSYLDKHVPGYGPGENQVTMRVLGPILEEFAPGKFGLRDLGPESFTRNGHSIVIRLDYGQARILLTGDLNTLSQRLLLSYHPASEFAVDVAKACHHGAEDIDISFTKAIKARATIISSGDNEAYSHPRPLAMGASARYGREAVGLDGKALPPLTYSTELARSVKLCFAKSVEVDLAEAPPPKKEIVEDSKTRVMPDQDKAKYRRLPFTPIATDLIYGLVNVRTDGKYILLATLYEAKSDFDIQVIKAGVNPD